MTRRALPTTGLLLLGLALPAAAQQTQQSIPPLKDPANLAGERVSAPALADDLPINHGAAALEQLLRKLRTRASLMLIVAHPDDEDSGLLTLESRGLGARVAMLTLTRGEGGQNLMSADFDDALGLIRTQELLAEDRFSGVDQFFGTEIDFGFSKTKEEAFRKWTHDRVLYDAVRSVRLYRPLVLASVFVGGPTDGHGQHQVSGEITQEVFKAAADPNVFPEMLKDGLPAWAPLKVYARVPFSRVRPDGMFDYATGKTIPPRFQNYVTGVVSDKPPVATVTIHEGDVPNIPAFHGLSYVQWARQGLALQKTQIGAGFRVPPAGVVDVGYTLMGSRLNCAQTTTPTKVCPLQAKPGLTPSAELPTHEDSIFEGIDTSLEGIASLAPHASPNVKVIIKANLAGLDQSIGEAQRVFNPGNTAALVPVLAPALERLDSFIANLETLQPASLPADEARDVLHELRVKRVELNDALVLAAGLTLKASVASSAVLTDARSINVQTTLANQGSSALKRSALEIDGPANVQLKVLPDKTDPDLKPAAAWNKASALPLPNGVPETKPYFYRTDPEQAFYDISDPALRNAPATPPPFSVRCSLNSGPFAQVEIAAAVQPAGQTTPPVAVSAIPAAAIALLPRNGIITPQETSVSLHLSMHSNDPARTLDGFKLTLQEGARILSDNPLVPAYGSRKSAEDRLQDQFIDFPIAVDSTQQTIKVSADLKSGQHTYSESFRPVGYDGLTPTNLYTAATYHGTAVDVTTAPHLRVAYLAGTGDSVLVSLHNLGVEPEQIFPNELTAALLARYDEVILGVRAYAAHPNSRARARSRCWTMPGTAASSLCSTTPVTSIRRRRPMPTRCPATRRTTS